MHQGLGLRASVEAPQPGRTGRHLHTAPVPQPCGLAVPWHVYNDTAWHGGRISLAEATARSTNTAFVALATRAWRARSGTRWKRSASTARMVTHRDLPALSSSAPRRCRRRRWPTPMPASPPVWDGLPHLPRHRGRPGATGARQPKPSCRQVADRADVAQATKYRASQHDPRPGILNHARPPPPARPALRTATPSRGSSATRHSCRRRSGSATRRTRPAGCSTSPWPASRARL